MKIKWVNDQYGSSSSAGVLRGAMKLRCHYDILGKGEERQTHPYSIWVGKRKIGRAADSASGQKFANEKFIELMKEQLS